MRMHEIMFFFDRRLRIQRAPRTKNEAYETTVTIINPLWSRSDLISVVARVTVNEIAVLMKNTAKLKKRDSGPPRSMDSNSDSDTS